MWRLFPTFHVFSVSGDTGGSERCDNPPLVLDPAALARLADHGEHWFGAGVREFFGARRLSGTAPHGDRPLMSAPSQYKLQGISSRVMQAWWFFLAALFMQPHPKAAIPTT